ncbi:MAG: Mov34/MPN/PAD-1 family protein [Lentisphaeria bacterium]|nr:Mov34/MPN/PAD-1 family protein [Lentisphaeria bacterium]
MQNATNQKCQLETGGLLAGYFSADNSEVVVTKIVTAGPNAVHGIYSYVPDYEADREAIGKIYDETDGLESYLGDWHSHPIGGAYLSWRDRRALKNIARFEGNFVESPVMLIIGLDLDDIPYWKAWRIFRNPGSFLISRWCFQELEARIFE